MQPIFSNLLHSEQTYNAFYNYTKDKKFESNPNLNEVANLFDKVHGILRRINPIYNSWDGTGDKNKTLEAMQWELDNLHTMKTKLAQAIKYKRSYYQHHWMGKITRIFLKILGLWNNGNTSAIKSAEQRLLVTDTRNKLIKHGGKYIVCHYFFPLVTTDWVRKNLNTQEFFNYNPQRKILLKDNNYWNNGKIEAK